MEGPAPAASVAVPATLATTVVAAMESVAAVTAAAAMLTALVVVVVVKKGVVAPVPNCNKKHHFPPRGTGFFPTGEGL